MYAARHARPNLTVTSPPSPASRAVYLDYATWAPALIGLLLILQLDLLPALFTGLMVYELVQVIVPRIERHIRADWAKFVVVTVIAIFVMAGLALAILSLASFFRSNAGNLPLLLQKMAEILERSRAMLPADLEEYIPTDAQELAAVVVDWLRRNAASLGSLGTETVRTAAHILVGMVIGGLLALHTASRSDQQRPFARALTERSIRLGTAFRRVVFAQVWISAINTTFTAIYLTLVLPAFGVDLPLIKTMIVVTFIAGLLPVLGNLISNSVTVIVSLSYSLQVALASLLFLVLVHKLEYFLNARIIGAHIRARAWELLIAMLVMEAAFGIPGVIAAPIYYAYIKDELAEKGLV